MSSGEEGVVESDLGGLWREAAAETERQLMPGTGEAATATGLDMDMGLGDTHRLDT